MWKLKIAEGGEGLISGNNFIGRQHWEFDPNAGTPQERAEVERLRQQFTKNRFSYKQCSDLIMRMQLTKENPCGPIPAAVKVGEEEKITEEALITTIRRALSFYSSIQAHDGHWPAECSGDMFFIPPLVMALYVTGSLDVVFGAEHRKEIIRYLYNHQNEDDGWGFHIEGPSTMFGSVLSYITLRILGEEPEDGENRAMARGRKWILDHGGLVAIPSWGKFLTSVLGVYEWSGINPLPPEFWLLPKFAPINPGHIMYYCRLVYLPLSYIYGKRFVGPITNLIKSLREELYNEPYDHINWNKARNTIAKEDLYCPHSLIQDILWGMYYHVGERLLNCWPFSMLREKAIKMIINQIQYEDENSKYLNIGIIVKALGSQTWDTAFATQAILCCNMSEEFGPTLKKAHHFLKSSQVRENPSGDFMAMYRHISKGGWTLSMQDQGLQVSDCTAEALKAALVLSRMPTDLVGEEMGKEGFYDAVNVILSLQSRSGGFSAWEPQTAYQWLDKFNPTEMFEGCFIETGYVECTGSALQALALFRKLYPNHRRKEIDHCISRGIHFIENTQNPDGSWYGSWGICYTYAAWLAAEGLAACGKNYHNSASLRNSCQFLLSKQLPNGGWGESYLSCQNKVYTNLEGNRPNLVQTSWALLSLIKAGQEVTGAYFMNSVLNYGAYRNIFPIWALGEYRSRVLYA